MARTVRRRSAGRAAARRGAVVDRGIPVESRARRVVEEVPVRRSVIVEEPVDLVVDQPMVRREAWSPAQLVSMAIGAAFILLGLVALVRASTGAGDLMSEVTVAGFHHTGLLGLVELFFGLTLLGIGAIPGAARPLMIFFGSVLMGFGLLVAVAARDLHGSLGVHGGHAVLYLLAGSVLVLAAAASPLFVPGTRRRVEEEPVVERTVYG